MALSIGTAQFGLDYGVTNRTGIVSPEEVSHILELGRVNGITMLDTAIAYGTSEQVLGAQDLSGYSITTKIPSLSTSSQPLESLVEGSLNRLNVDGLYGLMLHDEKDVAEPLLIKELHSLKAKGLVEKVGASFYSPKLAISAIRSGAMDIIQVPANQLDSRFQQAGLFEISEEYGVEVHIRSLFLQGLLVTHVASRPARFQTHPDLQRYDKYCHVQKCSSLELALQYLHKDTSSLTGVVGCTSAEQLKEIISAYNTSKKIKLNGNDALFSDDQILLNPSKW